MAVAGPERGAHGPRGWRDPDGLGLGERAGVVGLGDPL